MTTITTEVVEQLPVEAVIPDPGNRKADPDPQFVASVRTHGVIQPLLVTPHAEQEGRYELVAGHRRLGAARKVGLQTVPALVRVLTEEERLTLALVDNIQRKALHPIEEAVAMSRILDLGASVTKVAKAIGRSAGYVRDRLKLMELPAQARSLVDDNTISIEDGLALVGLVDHPEVLAAVVADIAGGRHGDVEWMVSSALRQTEADAKVAAGRAKAEAKGLTIVEHEGYQPTGYVELGTYRGLEIDGKAHAKEPCHAVVVAPRDGALLAVCAGIPRNFACRGYRVVCPPLSESSGGGWPGSVTGRWRLKACTSSCRGGTTSTKPSEHSESGTGSRSSSPLTAAAIPACPDSSCARGSPHWPLGRSGRTPPTSACSSTFWPPAALTGWRRPPTTSPTSSGGAAGTRPTPLGSRPASPTGSWRRCACCTTGPPSRG